MRIRQAKKILFGPWATCGHWKWSWKTIHAAKRRYRKLTVKQQERLVRGWGWARVRRALKQAAKQAARRVG